MAEKIRWGLLSTAGINEVIINGIRKTKRSELAAVASRDIEKAKAYASAWTIPKAYGSYKEMLDDPEIDAVYISLPNILHREWTVKAADAGKHILCEKPITTTIADFNMVEAAAKKNNIILFEAFMYLHHPQTFKIRELVGGGKLGNIKIIDSCFDYYQPPEEKDNIHLNPQLHGGVLWGVGVYPNSLSITLAGGAAPVEVYCEKTIGETGVDIFAWGHLKFGNGIAAQISVSMRSPLRTGTYIVGDRGNIFIKETWKPGLDGNKSSIEYHSVDGKKEIFEFPAVSPYQSEVETMEDCILDGSDPVLPMSLSRTFLLSNLALRKSAAKGKIIKL
ncbi:MAG: Gfo/Idh/MocA family protein [Planctomycetota bacterium]|jgi:predicted dehydrogenase